MDVLEFQRKWIGASSQKERSNYVTHFNDLCALLDVPTPHQQDPAGTAYAFERGADKATGGQGWADVWYRGHFAVEYKGLGKDLDRAYQQLLAYKDALENPPLLVVCDFNLIRIKTNFTNTVQQTHEFDLNSLNQPGVLATLKRMWTDPESFRPTDTPDTVTIAAAERFSQIAAGLHARGENPERAAHFLVQVVFCLFAEDIRLLPDRIFSTMVNANRRDPAQFQADAQDLLAAMATGGRVAYKRIPHVNGGLFATVDVPRLDVGEITLIREASELDWSQIEPAIFGTLFERSLDPTKRSQLGAHYTSRADIERVVTPVVMDPLRRRFADLQAAHAALGDSPTARKMGPLLKQTDAFLADLRQVTVLDPACGSGNFLYVALSELLTLEKEVMTWRATVAGTSLGFPEIKPTQVKGIEINAYAQQLAQAAIWIGYLQWMTQNGFGWTEPVLAPLDSIEHRDALLAFADDGTATEAEWPAATYIIGNPPFLGNFRMRAELGDAYTETLYRIFGPRIPNGSDLCCYFFEKARISIEGQITDRSGLLATNSIRGGANREVLKRIKTSGDIYMAWSDEEWILEGAAVRISIVGFDEGTEGTKTLNGKPVTAITPSLTAGIDLNQAARLIENSELSFEGVKKTGPFDIPEKTALEWLALPLNPNGKPNSEVVRRYVNSRDIAQRDARMWVVDFGVSMPVDEAALYEMPFQHVLENVKPIREKTREARARARWWIHQRPRPEMRRAIQGLERFLVTGIVAKYRLFSWLSADALPSNLLAVFARDDDYFFGVLHSRAHEVWSLRMGTSLEDRPRYTPTTCFETFPLPWPPGDEPDDDPRVIAIADAARELDQLRSNWLNPDGASEAELKKRTLTNLYNQRPTWLANAHDRLDCAVWSAYAWPPDETPADVPEDTILARLLDLNRERSESSS